MSESQSIQQKLYRIAVVFLAVVGIIMFLTSTISRIHAACESKDYILTTGTVSDIWSKNEKSTKRRQGDYLVYGFSVKYQPTGSLREKVLNTDYVFRSPRTVGEEVSVMYHRKNTSEAYIAEKDWLTGKYIPLTKTYDMWLGASIAIMGAALALCGWTQQWKNENKGLVMFFVGIIIAIIGVVFFSANEI